MHADPTADEIQRVMEHWGAVVARKTLLTAFTRGQIERATALNSSGSPVRFNLPWAVWNLLGEQAVFLLSRKR